MILPETIESGKLLIEGATRLLPGTHYNFTSGGHTLIRAVDPIPDRELRYLAAGRISFALVVKDEALFLLFRFGSRSWGATHYNWWLNPPQVRPDPFLGLMATGFAIPLKVCLVDAGSGVVTAARTCRLSARFSRLLLGEVARQVENGADPGHHLDVAGKVLAANQDANRLLDEALCLQVPGNEQELRKERFAGDARSRSRQRCAVFN